MSDARLPEGGSAPDAPAPAAAPLTEMWQAYLALRDCDHGDEATCGCRARAHTLAVSALRASRSEGAAPDAPEGSWRCEGCGAYLDAPGDHTVLHKGQMRACGPVSWDGPKPDTRADLARLRAALGALGVALDRADSNRGRFSTVETHDGRCPKGRVATPDKWRGAWVCECGSEALDAACDAARALLGDAAPHVETRVETSPETT